MIYNSIDKYLNSIKVKDYKYIKNFIAFVCNMNKLNIIFLFKRKFLLKKDIHMLQNNDKIININILLKFIRISINKETIISLDYKMNITKHDNNYKILWNNLNISFNNVQNLYEIKNLFILTNNENKIELYDNVYFTKIKLKSLKIFDFINKIRYSKKIIKIEVNYNKILIYNIKDLKLLKIKNLKENDIIKSYNEYSSYFTLSINNLENTFSYYKKNFKVFDIFKKYNNLLNFKFFQNYFSFENKDYELIIYRSMDLKLIEIDTRGKTINYFEELKYCIKLSIDFNEFYILDKKYFQKIELEGISKMDKITYYEEYKKYFKIKINEEDQNILYLRKTFKKLKFEKIIDFKNISEIYEFKNKFIILYNNEYFMYDIKIWENNQLKYIKLFNNIKKIENKDNYLKIINKNKELNFYNHKKLSKKLFKVIFELIF